MRDAENIHLELDKQIAVYIYTKNPRKSRKFIKTNVDKYTQYMPYFFFFYIKSPFNVAGSCCSGSIL